MKTFGISTTHQLVNLPVTPEGLPDWMACTPEGRFVLEDERAPWNAPDPAPLPTFEIDGEPAPLTAVCRDPAGYPGVLWTPPQVVPLVKLPVPSVSADQIAEPVLHWYEDRVERDWEVRSMTPEELAEFTRKIWENTSAFFGEFSVPEAEAIAVSTHPTVCRLRLRLSTWAGRVFSDDPHVAGGLSLLVAVGILTSERRAEITTKTTP